MHGWGFDAGFWQPLAALLDDCRAVSDDRGYFGPPHEPAIAEDCLVVAHSFGAMRALAAPPPHCRGMVAVNGFDRFVPAVPRRVLDRMIARLQTAPSQVLADFRRRCGDDTPVATPVPRRLHEDLVIMRDGDFSTRELLPPGSSPLAGESQVGHPPFPILSLQAANDPLLPQSLRDGAFAGAAQVERRVHPAGGHLLPVSEAPYCARAIRDFMERLA